MEATVKVYVRANAGRPPCWSEEQCQMDTFREYAQTHFYVRVLVTLADPGHLGVHRTEPPLPEVARLAAIAFAIPEWFRGDSPLRRHEPFTVGALTLSS